MNRLASFDQAVEADCDQAVVFIEKSHKSLVGILKTTLSKPRVGVTVILVVTPKYSINRSFLRPEGPCGHRLGYRLLYRWPGFDPRNNQFFLSLGW